MQVLFFLFQNECGWGCVCRISLYVDLYVKYHCTYLKSQNGEGEVNLKIDFINIKDSKFFFKYALWQIY